MSQDTINVQRGIVGAGSDNDTYILSGNLIDANADITISDVEGANTIQLIGGLTITSSIVAGDTLQLVLSNGAVVTVLGASTMSFEVGGNPLTGEAGVTKDYSTFTTDILFTDVPTTGTAIGGTSTVNEDGSATAGSGTGVVSALTTSADSLTGTSESEMFSGLLSTTTTTTTFNDTDSIIDISTADSDVLTLSLENDVTAATSAVIRNIETVNVNADATTLGGDTELAFAATNFSGINTYNFDVTKAVSAVSKLNVTDLNDGNTVVASDDFSVVALAASAATDNLVVDVQAMGTTGTPTTVTLTGAATDLAVTGAGDLSVTATASTGLLQATAEKGLALSGAAANVHIAEAKAGDLSVADATAAKVAQYTATGDVSINNLGAGELTVNAGGTLTLTGTLGTTSATLASVGSASSASAAGALATLSLSGNGAAASYDLSAGTAALNDVTLTGDQDVTLKLGTTNATLNVYDTATAGDFTLELSAAAGVDLTGGDLIDRLELGADNSGNTLAVKSTQNVVITADQTATNTIAVGSAASKATNSVTLTLSDETLDTSAVDLNGTTITQAKTVTIDGSVDTTSAGSSNGHTITALNASDGDSDVTINMGVNNLTLASANTVGTGTLTITGSGTVTLGAATLTASTLDASAVTGSVTGTALNPTNVAVIKTGSAADTLTLANTVAADLNLSTAAGNDSITLAGVTTAEKTTVIDLGDDSDTLKFQASTKLIAGTAGSVTVSGIETIEFANGTGQEIQGSALSGETYNIVSAATGNTNTVTVAVGSTAAAVDLSQLVGSSTTATAVTGMTFDINASANANTVTIKGMANAKNVIAGSLAADTLTGGTKNDIFDYADADRLFDSSGVMQDTIDGGTGTDSLRLTAATALTIANTDDWSKITGVESITAGASATAITLALDLSAQTAGIVTVDLSDDNTTGVNVVDASEYTTAITMTGVGAGGIDTLTGGAGDDTFVYKLKADLGTANIVDTVNGGAGTDTLLIGTSGTAFNFANNDTFSRITNVETIKAAANTEGHNVVLDVTAWAAGIRTVDLSAADSDTVTAPSASTIDAGEIVGGDMTLIGSATGATTFTGGTGVDTMTGGSSNDTFNVGIGKDVIKFGASAAANGVDVITVAGVDTTVGADNVVYDFSAFLGSGYTVIGSNNINTTMTMVAQADTADVDLTGKLAVLSVSNAVAVAGTADVDTAAELFALIDGTGDAFALTAGKAVVMVHEASSATGADDANAHIFMIDTTADGTAGLSVSDITLVGTAANINDATAAQFVFTSESFA